LFLANESQFGSTCFLLGSLNILLAISFRTKLIKTNRVEEHPMAPDQIPRRRLLQATGVGIIAGTAGRAAASSLTPTAPSGVVDNVTYRHGWVYIATANPAQTDAVRLLNPHGQQVAQQDIGLAETVASINLLDNGSYVGGRFTVEALEAVGDTYDRIGRGAFACSPTLEVTGFNTGADGWPQITVANTGSGPADILGIRCASGFPTPGTSQLPGRFTPIDPGTTLLLEFDTDGLAPTMTTERSERARYAGETIDAEITLATAGFGIFETTLPLTWSEETGFRSHGDNPTIYFCNSVTGGEFA
jgi:hypothetical protein